MSSKDDVETQIRQRLAHIEQRIAVAASVDGRTVSDVLLVAVSKNQPLERVLAYQRVLHSQGRVATFGENYVQEFAKKKELLLPGYRSHYIGTLQRNKAQDAVALFDLMESVHSAEVAGALERACVKLGKNLPVFLQVNISRDLRKSGLLPEQVHELVARWSLYPHLQLEGLMTITLHYESAEAARQDFRALRSMRDNLLKEFKDDVTKLELSMGMSQDFEVAIEEGATVVRIGTALFGERSP